MGAIGNDFWKQRSKHGRGMIFSSAQLMWEAACEYFEWCNNNPLVKNETCAYQGVISTQEVKTARPYMWQGLALYCGTCTDYFKSFRHLCKNDTEKEDFSTVLKMIEDVIFNQQYDGASAGYFKEGLTARYLKLKESTEISTPSQGDGEFEVSIKIS